MNRSIKSILTLALFGIIATIPSGVFAQSPIGEIVLPEAWQRWLAMPNAEDGGALALIIQMLFRLVVTGAGLFAVWQVISAGFSFITSDGDPQKLAEGRNRLIWTLVGLVVILGSFVLVAIIGFLFTGDAMFFIVPEISGPSDL